jgi:hypothetical protein
MKYPLAPLVVAIVLGDSTERELRKALIASGGSPLIFVGSPLAATLMILAIILLLVPVIRNVRERARTFRVFRTRGVTPLDIALIVLAFGLILVGAEVFTNGIEWLGIKLNMSEGATGSILAALGTATPETLIPVGRDPVHQYDGLRRDRRGSHPWRAVHARDAGHAPHRRDRLRPA